MNRAEHSPPNPSAPHGAPPAVVFPVSPNPSRASNRAHCLTPAGDETSRTPRRTLPMPTPEISLPHPSHSLAGVFGTTPRRHASGCVLVAVLALGTGAQSAPRTVIAPRTAMAAAQSAAGKTGTQTKSRSAISRSAALRSAASLAISGSLAQRITVAGAPRARLMPRTTQTATPQFPAPGAALKIAQSFGREIAQLNAKGVAASAPQWTASSKGGGKMIRLASAKDSNTFAGGNAPAPSRARFQTISSPLSAPTSASLAPLAPVKIKPLTPDLGGMKKVIDASNLALPPLSQPLPTWMQNAAVKIDRIEKPATQRTAQNNARSGALPPRFAQNPGAAPIRNPSAPVTNSDRLPNQIEVAVSTFVVLLTTTDLQTVAVADPNIADVAVVNSRSVLLNGKTAGVTSLVIVDGQKIRQYKVSVTASPGSRAVDIAGAIGIPGVTVRPLKDALVLEGEVGSAEEARRATEIAGIYATKVVNQLSIRGQVSQEAGAAAQLRDLINLPNVNVRVSGDTAILSGTVDSPQQIQDADIIARTAAKNVVNLLRLPTLTLEQLRETLGAGDGSPIGGVGGTLGATDGAPGAPIGSNIGGPSGAGAFGTGAFGTPGIYSAPSPLVLRQAGGSLLLQGTVGSQAQLDQVLSLAARTGLPIVNRLQAPAALSAEQGALSSVAQAIGRPGVRVSGTLKRLVLEGVVDNTEEAVAVEQIARAFAAQVDNLLQTPNPRLVDVDVSIVEITNNGLKNLGFTFPSLLDASGTGLVLGQRSVNLDSQGPLTPGAGSPNSIRGALTQQTAFQAALRAEITNQNVRLLSNPRTTVLSGRTATFQVGGQVPVPVSITQSATGTITGIAFKDFGVLVDVVPNASANGSVTMRVKTEISQPDASIGFQPVPNAGIIPGFQRRAATTEVTTAPGGTIALGGLISTDTRTLVRKVPLLGNLPILGSLFTSKRFQNNQTELVIFVTPRLLANPLPAGTTAAAGVVAVGNNSNIGTILGNPGLATGGVTGAASAP